MEPDHCICKHSDIAQLKPPISRIIPCMILAPSLAADYPTSESKNIFCSFDVRYYDETITKLHLQAIEKYQYGTPQYQQREKLQQQEEEREEELHDQTRNKRILLVDDEPDHCMFIK